jgi:hypothetical protein
MLHHGLAQCSIWREKPGKLGAPCHKGSHHGYVDVAAMDVGDELGCRLFPDARDGQETEALLSKRGSRA